MDIRDLKHAEDILINSTQNPEINTLIEEETSTWTFEESDSFLPIIHDIQQLLSGLREKILGDNVDETSFEALEWIVFNKIHDTIVPWVRGKFVDEDVYFFEKCMSFYNLKVSAEQFGADENYTIPLSAAVVELSMIDSYKSPQEKMNCLCSTYDLVFAEIKTAIISIISENAEKENEIPIINNSEVIPVLMAVIVQSKLVHLFTNLFFIKRFYHKIHEKRVVSDILKAFETAIKKLIMLDVKNIRPTSGKIIRSMDPAEYIKMTLTSTEYDLLNRTLVDEANQRVLKLITRSTSEVDIIP